MRTPSSQPGPEQLEELAEFLKERIYATLALLAVLLSIDANHTSPLKAAVIVGGTALSLWAASLVSTQMARRVVMPHQAVQVAEVRRQIQRHAPLLAAAVFPLLIIWLAAVRAMSLEDAVNISIAGSMLLLAGWSIGSARAMRATRLPTIILVAVEMLIGLAVVMLKFGTGLLVH